MFAAFVYLSVSTKTKQTLAGGIMTDYQCSRFWRFEMDLWSDFDRGDCMPFDPIEQNWKADMNGPLFRFCFGHRVESIQPKAVFVCWKIENDTVSGWIEYDQLVARHRLADSQLQTARFAVAPEMARIAPRGYFHQRRVNHFDTALEAYHLTARQALGVMAPSDGAGSCRFPMCRGPLCWCYDCAMDSIGDDTDDKVAAAKRYATYVRGRYLEKNK
jgi:hypothetical protein